MLFHNPQKRSSTRLSLVIDFCFFELTNSIIYKRGQRETILHCFEKASELYSRHLLVTVKSIIVKDQFTLLMLYVSILRFLDILIQI